VWAARDPGSSQHPGSPLEQLQIIKGWLQDGELEERVIHLAGAATPSAGVDPSTCQTTGGGFDSLCEVWEDPDFDAEHRAFYYARAVEVPVCRWSQRVCVARGVRCDDPKTVPDAFAACCSDSHVPVIRERAWSSPIWFSP
jgi:hypothetical protein